MSEHALVPVGVTAEAIRARVESGHSVFSPSGSEMWMTCPGSLIPNLLAEDRAGYEAAEGTVAHSLAEEWLKTGERPDHAVGFEREVNDFVIPITEEMLEFVADFVEWCERVAAESEHWASEQRVDFSRLTPIPEQKGTADFIAFRWQHLTIIDLKYGKDPVFARQNKQLRIYALGVFYEWDWLYNFQTIDICIAQPRLPGGMTTWTITREELLAFAEEVREAAALAWQPNADRVPSAKGCRWCRIQTKCPANYLFMANELDVFDNHDEIEAKDMVIDVTPTRVTYDQMESANEIILDEMAVSPFPHLPDPPELSTKALAKLLRYRKLMDTFFGKVHAELLNRAISDEEDLTWWKVVVGRANRKWVEDEDWLIDQILARFPRLTRADLFVTKMATPAEMERIIHTKAKEAKLTFGKIKDFLTENGLAVKPPGQKTLAAVDDPRLAAPRDTDVFFNYDEADDDI